MDMAFKVTNIIDGNTIQVSGWKWGDYEGKTVKIVGYSFAGKGSDYDSIATNRLTNLLLGKEVELKKVNKAEKGDVGQKDDIIYCSVILNGVDISQYFPEFKTSV